MHQIEVIHTRVFAADVRGGNPCPVILDADSLDDNEMLTVARRFGLDTVFILKPKAETTDVSLRFFVPDHEMGVSGHATIAAITVALIQGRSRPLHRRIETSSGLFAFQCTQNKRGHVVTLEQNAPVFGCCIAPDRVAPTLGISPHAIASNESPIQTVSVSRPKLIVPLKDRQTLNQLKPDFEALWQLCDAEKVTGLYPFSRDAYADRAEAEARQFPLRAGFYEDAATGVAAAALGAYLAKHDLNSRTGHHEFRVAHGYAMGAPSLIEAIAECEAGSVTRTAIRGVAQILRSEQVHA
ncbi:MAG TPA: PhzF family phenazine biosynthesis isomerase [Terriglobales bacterium]|nr:PhzF family phenazine biosynthesis isomerase [Terriglobales bacterium]